jgi:hypothetical protein
MRHAILITRDGDPLSVDVDDGGLLVFGPATSDDQKTEDENWHEASLHW